MSRQLTGRERGGFSRLHRLPAKKESVTGAGFGEVITHTRSIVAEGRLGSDAVTYVAKQQISMRNQRAVGNRYELVMTSSSGLETTVTYEDGNLVHPEGPAHDQKLYKSVAETVTKGFDGADNFFVNDPEIIALMDPVERALRQLYKGPEQSLDPDRESPGTSYGIYGDSR